MAGPASDDRDIDPEGAALSLATFRPRHPVVGLRDVPHDRETKTRTTRAKLGSGGIRGPGARPIHFVEALKDAREMTGRDPDPLVADDEAHVSGPGLPANPDRSLWTAELDRIVDQVHEGLFEARRIR